MIKNRVKEGLVVWTLLFGFGTIGPIESAARTPSVAAQAQSNGHPVRALNIVFGIKDQQPTRWDGSVTISKGQIVKLRGHHFGKEDKIGPDHSWAAGSTAWIESGPGIHTHGLSYPYPTRVLPIGVTVYYRAAEDAELSLKTENGDFSFRISDVPASAPLHPFRTQIEIFRVPPVEHCTKEEPEDDYPSIAVGSNGSVGLAWIGYRNKADQVYFRQSNSGSWSQPVKATERPGDLYGTDIAVDSRGRFWVAWSERSDRDWHLKVRSLDGKSWGRIETLTSGSGNNLFHRLVADSRGSLHVVWQSARRGRFDVYYRSMTDDSWSEEICLSDPDKGDRTNDWSPDVAVDSKGTAWVAWDTYEGGSYNIRMRPIRKGKPGKLMRVTDTPRFHAHPSLAVDAQDRVWVSYDEAEENWGKDSGFLLRGGASLYQSRKISVIIYDGSRWLSPRQSLDQIVRPNIRRYVQTPKLVADTKGRMWAFFRPRTLANLAETVWAGGGKWEMMATYYAGDRWADPITMPESGGRNEGPFDAAAAGNGAVHLVWVTDQRVWGGPAFGYPPNNNQVLMANVVQQFDNTPVHTAQLGPPGTEPPTRLPSEPREQDQVAAIRNYTIHAHGKTYKVRRGDMHRHTDISRDGSGDGSLFDSYRYMIDAAAMDFYLVTDHNSGDNVEYSWWRIEKSEDMFHLPGFFVTLFGYERNLPYPNGHRNVIYSKRGNRTLEITDEERADHTGPILYPHLRKTNGIATSHTSHTVMGTDWRDNDPELEPIVEIFQGARTSAEHAGAPLSPSDERTDLWAGGYRPLGFVWKAWEKGYKLGVQASSDHISTHTSYAMVLVEDYTRDGLVNAMRKRHTYGATSNIILDFQIHDGATVYIHGDAYSSSKIPELVVKVLGTDDIKEAVVVRDNKYVYQRAGSGETAQFTFREPSLKPGEHYYYVRVEQEDGNVAWSSPIWVTYR